MLAAIYASQMMMNTATAPPSPPTLWVPMVRFLASGADSSRDLNAIAMGSDGVSVAVFGSGYASRQPAVGSPWNVLPRSLGIDDTWSMFTVATNDAGVFIVGADNGRASRSTDNGGTFSALPTNLGSGASSSSIRKIAHAHGVWVAVFNGGYAARSTGVGATWTGLTRWLNSGASGSALTVAGFGAVWFFGFAGGYASISTDGAVTRSPLTLGLGLEVGNVNDAAFTSTGRLIVAIGDKVGFSDNNGASFTNASFGGTSPYRVVAHGEIVLVLCSTGSHRLSVDNGATYTSLSAGLNSGATTQTAGCGAAANGRWMVGFREGFASVSPSL